MEDLKNELLDTRGYDMDFLNAFTNKGVVCLHYTEFFYDN